MEDIFVLSQVLMQPRHFFFSLQMINADVQNTNTACLHSVVYINGVTDKYHPED